MNTSTHSIQDEIDFLRSQIAALEQAEMGSASEASPAGPPSTIIMKDFTVDNQKKGAQEAPVKHHTDIVCNKGAALIIGAVILVGMVIGLVNLSHFMTSSNIHFVQGDPGTATITAEELALHNTPDDCWMVLYGKVYDLTNYAKRHPGGAAIVTNLAGTDGTAQYERFHSESLLRSVEGDIVGTFSTASGGSSGSPNNNNNNNNNSSPVTAPGAPPAVSCSTANNCVTMEELRNHNTASDCWIALYGNVYDLTNYARRHPGGASIVTQLAGTDGTSEYARFHPSSLLADVRSDLIGPYEGGTENVGNNNQGGGQGNSGSDDSGD